MESENNSVNNLVNNLVNSNQSEEPKILTMNKSAPSSDVPPVKLDAEEHYPLDEKAREEAKKRHDIHIASSTIHNVKIVSKTIDKYLKGRPISKDNIPSVVAAALLSMMRIKNTTNEQKKQILLIGMNRYLNDSSMLDETSRQDILLAAEVSFDNLFALYEQTSKVKSCCVIL
jgi:hypothetical protein